MFILNKKNGNIQECHNADAIKVCRKDTDHYAVAAAMEELEGKAAISLRTGRKGRRRGKIPIHPKKLLLRPLRSSERERKSSRKPEEPLKAVKGSRKEPEKEPGRSLVPERRSPAREERIL